MKKTSHDAKRLTVGFSGTDKATLEKGVVKTGMSYAAFIEAWAIFGAEMVNSGKAAIVNSKATLGKAA